MLEKTNNMLWKYNTRRQNISYLTSTYVVVIAVIFITIGIIFPNDFTLFGVPGLGVIQYIVILYLFGTIGFFYTTKKNNLYSVNALMKRKEGK